MKLKKYFFNLFFLLSCSFGQIVDVFISDWYIGWRGDGVYNNLVEIYNPKEDTVNLADYLFRRTQNGSGWLSTDPDHFLRSRNYSKRRNIRFGKGSRTNVVVRKSHL